MAINLKKKVGPLPVYGWVVLGAGAIGVVWYLHKSSSSSTAAAASSGIDPATGVPYAQELAAAQASGSSAYGDSGGGSYGGGSTPSDVATGTVTTDQIDSDLQTIQGEIATLSTNAINDTIAPPTIQQEAADLLAAQNALKTLGGGGSVSPTNGGTPAASSKSIAGQSIISQLDDLQSGLVTQAALGPGAQAALKAAGGNVAAAIAGRPPVTAASTGKTITRATTTIKPVKF